MKYIIIGLGRFGKALAKDLSTYGHEVIGVDIKMSEVDAVKEFISTAICMDTKEENAIQVLPLKDADAVYVTFGEDFGVSIHTVAVLKQLLVKRLIVRSISPLHETVLRSIGVSDIITPEDDFAHQYVANLELGNKLEQWYKITPSYHLLKLKTPQSLIGVKILDINFKAMFNVELISIIRGQSKKNIFGITELEWEVLQNINELTVLQQDDQLVIFGQEKYYKMLL